MCRIFARRSSTPFSIEEQLAPFAAMAKASKEFQGHGWGMAWLENGQWRFYRHIEPIWEHDVTGFGKTTCLMIHARSAFRNEGIFLENNMPFSDGEKVFIFNGELHGVRIKSEGRIGAEKIFNFIRRFDRGDTDAALRKATDIIRRRSDYVRGMNIIVCDGRRFYVTNDFGEDPRYFTLYRREDADGVTFCSQPLDGKWFPLGNGVQWAA
ncbi:class II glutamine amidotransferase [Acanthopleuribacter pedis]|uniref:Glutamine amidotransferase type-2 domain-containing protein n=1 Tax=Acanthopleuribacter pedis TaxID=442870 RepID=A0A8J7QPB6_9BACT|nr:hypothetical protein [Acanthopleuribacter pedis]MBO1321640.1 hypothetical protein [Acanthopleuribacter pedis]